MLGFWFKLQAFGWWEPVTLQFMPWVVPLYRVWVKSTEWPFSSCVIRLCSQERWRKPRVVWCCLSRCLLQIVNSLYGVRLAVVLPKTLAVCLKSGVFLASIRGELALRGLAALLCWDLLGVAAVLPLENLSFAEEVEPFLGPCLPTASELVGATVPLLGSLFWQLSMTPLVLASICSLVLLRPELWLNAVPRLCWLLSSQQRAASTWVWSHGLQAGSALGICTPLPGEKGTAHPSVLDGLF